MWRIYSLFGFFFGSTLAGSGVYYYVLQEYKTSNELLTGDIYVRPRTSFYNTTAIVTATPRHLLPHPC